MSTESQAVMEIAQLIASQSSPAQIIDFHASPEMAERAYALIDAERAGTISMDERRELDSYEAIEHIVIHAKSAARRQLQ